MKRILFCALVMLCLDQAAHATDQDSNYERGSSAAANGDNDNAISYLTKAIDLDDLSDKRLALAYLQRAGAYEAGGKLDLAILDYSAYIKIMPNEYLGYDRRGMAEYESHRFAEAIGDYSTCIDMKPKLSAPYVVRGIAYMQLHKLDNALEDLNEAVSIKPADSNILGARGDVYRFQGKFDEALADYNAALNSSASNFNAFYGRGLIRDQRGEYANALADLQATVQLNAKWGDARNVLGRIEWQLGQFSDAADQLEQAMQLSPSPYRAIWLYLARERNGQDGTKELTDDASKIELGKWPGPVVSLYLGKASTQDVQQSANSASPAMADQWRCEVNFFDAEWSLMHNNKTAAKALLIDAAHSCPTGEAELPSAKAELDRLFP